ncbi:unnamed protein product [Peronospora belbahrii]|uniref:Endonuclease/exonuclease/phosphatase domain-containing protein n=1 Tax=Peronospora belbahrii TaxID=622444 RepID=A0ABN8D4E0_9STRA|nr:unnamed protein product [Peronospora belbahrii]
MLQLSVSTNLAAPMQAYKQLTRLQFLETTIKCNEQRLTPKKIVYASPLSFPQLMYLLKLCAFSAEAPQLQKRLNHLQHRTPHEMLLRLRRVRQQVLTCFRQQLIIENNYRPYRRLQCASRFGPKGHEFQSSHLNCQRPMPKRLLGGTKLSFASTGECAGDCQWNERNSIFYRLDRWELLETATFALSNTPAVLPSNTWGLEYLRAAVIARFRDKKINRVVCMLNTHFDIRLGHSQSAVLVAKQLSQRCQPEDTVLMTGDLNTGTQSSAVQYIIGQDPIDEGFTPIPMYETLTAASADGPTWIGSSFGNHVVGSKLDYIFSRRDNHTCLRTATILTDTFDGYSSSDHAVLLSKFCLGTECVGCIA